MNIRKIIREEIEGFTDNFKLKLLGTLDGVKIYLINSDILSKTYPVWNNYLGSHHYGKKSSHIPKDEIYISDKVPYNELKKIIYHEYVERSIMKSLQINYKMTPEKSWEIAHYFVKDKLGL